MGEDGANFIGQTKRHARVCSFDQRTIVVV